MLVRKYSHVHGWQLLFIQLIYIASHYQQDNKCRTNTMKHFEFLVFGVWRCKNANKWKNLQEAELSVGPNGAYCMIPNVCNLRLSRFVRSLHSCIIAVLGYRIVDTYKCPFIRTLEI